MPERSYPKVAWALAKSTTLSKRWAAEDGGQARAWACDFESFLDALAAQSERGEDPFAT